MESFAKERPVGAGVFPRGSGVEYDRNESWSDRPPSTAYRRPTQPTRRAQSAGSRPPRPERRDESLPEHLSVLLSTLDQAANQLLQSVSANDQSNDQNIDNGRPSPEEMIRELSLLKQTVDQLMTGMATHHQTHHQHEHHHHDQSQQQQQHQQQQRSPSQYHSNDDDEVHNTHMTGHGPTPQPPPPQTWSHGSPYRADSVRSLRNATRNITSAKRLNGSPTKTRATSPVRKNSATSSGEIKQHAPSRDWAATSPTRNSGIIEYNSIFDRHCKWVERPQFRRHIQKTLPLTEVEETVLRQRAVPSTRHGWAGGGPYRVPHPQKGIEINPRGPSEDIGKPITDSMRWQQLAADSSKHILSSAASSPSDESLQKSFQSSCVRLEQLWDELFYPEQERDRIRNTIFMEASRDNYQAVSDQVEDALRYRSKVVRALRYIKRREELLEQVEDGAVVLNADSVDRLLGMTFDCFRAIADWKEAYFWNKVFLYKEIDYEQKLKQDLAFLRDQGVSISVPEDMKLILGGGFLTGPSSVAA